MILTNRSDPLTKGQPQARGRRRNLVPALVNPAPSSYGEGLIGRSPRSGSSSEPDRVRLTEASKLAINRQND